ncbi:MAG: DUF5667 domain-containing protein, partial [Sciscionella sp.]
RGGHASPTRRGGVRGRLTVAAFAALCLVVALGGMSLLLSRGALPGDPLYAVKLGVQNASVDLTSGEQAKGLKYLQLADSRIAEARKLRTAGVSGDQDYRDALNTFADEARSGARTLLLAGANSNASAFTELRDWARAQQNALASLAHDMPAALRPRAARGVTLLRAIAARAQALMDRLGCGTITAVDSDALGPLPATGRCTRASSRSRIATPPEANPAPLRHDRGTASPGSTVVGLPRTASGGAAVPGIAARTSPAPAVRTTTTSPAVTGTPQPRPTLPGTATQPRTHLPVPPGLGRVLPALPGLDPH